MERIKNFFKRKKKIEIDEEVFLRRKIKFHVYSKCSLKAEFDENFLGFIYEPSLERLNILIINFSRDIVNLFPNSVLHILFLTYYIIIEKLVVYYLIGNKKIFLRKIDFI